MDPEIHKQLQFLGLKRLSETWEAVFSNANKTKPSYHRFLTEILQQEFSHKIDKRRLGRIKRARIPQVYLMDTFPFAKQPNLKKRYVLELYDSMSFITQKQDLIFIGPTGCGKTGLATAFLIHAIHHDYRGYFIEFKDLLDRLYQSIADHTEKKLLRRFQSYDCLLIDELGTVTAERQQAGLFFELMKKRNRQHPTLITTQLGFEEWGGFLNNSHLTAALLDRLTENCTVFNMKKCISLRPKNIVYAASDAPASVD